MSEHIAALTICTLSAIALAAWSLTELAKWADRKASERVDRMVREWVLDEASETFGPLATGRVQPLYPFPDDAFIDSLRADIAAAERAEFERAVRADIDRLTQETA